MIRALYARLRRWWLRDSHDLYRIPDGVDVMSFLESVMVDWDDGFTPGLGDDSGHGPDGASSEGSPGSRPGG